MAEKNKIENPSPLDGLNEYLHSDMAQVNALILERLKGRIPLIEEIGAYLIQSGGKRIRPLLTLACGDICQADKEKTQKLAAAVEFIHSATLLHDDVVDGSLKRRGKSSANEVFDNKAPVLVGDFLFSRSFQLMVEGDNMHALQTLSNAAAIIAEGEVLQLSLTNKTDITRDQYFDIIRGKTAALFASACEVAPILAAKDRDTQRAFHTYGLNLGMAFQIADDVLDYSSHANNMGKNVGDDFREGKITLPVIICLEQANEEEKKFWTRSMGNLEQKDGDLEKALKLIDAHKGVQKGQEIANSYRKNAQQALEHIPDSTVKQYLYDLTEFVILRES